MTNDRATSPGTRQDLASGSKLSQLHPFFGVAGSAERFVILGLGPFLDSVAPGGRPVTCVDVGGAEGVVAAAFEAGCKARGLDCDIIVVDENPQFLERAARRGFRTHPGPLADLTDITVDCAILRFVNHYNTAPAQAALARQLARLVRPGGVLAAQIETGDAATCRLHDRIAEALSPDTDAPGQHWPTLPAFQDTICQAGFELRAVLGANVVDETPAQARLDMAWRRRYQESLDLALISGNSTLAITLLNAREDFFYSARTILQDAAAPKSLKTIQPIVVFQLLHADTSNDVLMKGRIDEKI